MCTRYIQYEWPNSYIYMLRCVQCCFRVYTIIGIPKKCKHLAVNSLLLEFAGSLFKKILTLTSTYHMYLGQWCLWSQLSRYLNPSTPTACGTLGSNLVVEINKHLRGVISEHRQSHPTTVQSKHLHLGC